MGILERWFLGSKANDKAEAAKERLVKACDDFDAARADFAIARQRLLHAIAKPPPRPQSIPDNLGDWE